MDSKKIDEMFLASKIEAGVVLSVDEASEVIAYIKKLEQNVRSPDIGGFSIGERVSFDHHGLRATGIIRNLDDICLIMLNYGYNGCWVDESNNQYWYVPSHKLNKI